MKLASVRPGALLLFASLLQACGGGGGGNGGDGPPASNHAPIMAATIPDLQLIVGHSFRFDASQGGSSFTDPDGDRLIYEISFSQPAPTGLSANDSVISGTPKHEGSFSAAVRVTDGHGGENRTRILIDIAPNSRPVVLNPNPDVVLTVNNFVDLEVTRDGTVFTDADRDPLTYDVRFQDAAHGLTIVGTRVTGVMNNVGLVRVTVTARDGAGGAQDDTFSIVLPATAPGPPVLPSPPYTYADEGLGLPYLYQLSRDIRIPFVDTTPRGNPVTNSGATLGRVLFYDKRVSITNTHACASCHQQSHGFAAGERFSASVTGNPLTRNAMSLANVRYNDYNLYFWDQRIFSLENLVRRPIQNVAELGNPMDLLIPKLAATDFYPPLFEAAFGSPEITEDRIAKALAQFLRALISYRAKSDEAFLVRFEGDIPDPLLVLNAQEFRGLEIASQSFCFSCHAGDVLTVTAAKNNGLDVQFTDPGVGRGQFHPPSLKNIRVSGPYMHDGRFETLRDVINFYDHEVQDSQHLDSLLRDSLTNRPRKLNLSEADKDALEAFLDTLTDHAFLTDPRFSDPFDAQQ